MMGFYDVLAQVIEILQREGRTSYRALKRQFELDDDYLDDVKLELIEVKQIAVDQDHKMLVWTGDPSEREPDTQPETDTEIMYLNKPARQSLSVLHLQKADNAR